MQLYSNDGYTIPCLRKCTLIMLPRKKTSREVSVFIHSVIMSQNLDAKAQLNCYAAEGITRSLFQQVLAQWNGKSPYPTDQMLETWKWTECPVVKPSQGRNNSLFLLTLRQWMSSAEEVGQSPKSELRYKYQQNILMGGPQNLKLASLIGLRAWQADIFSQALSEHGLDYFLQCFLSF